MLRLNNRMMCDNCFAPVGVNGVCRECSSLPQVRVPSALPLNSILHGRYVVGKVLGKGGFSITYKAYDNKLDMIVAIKEFFPDMIVTRNSGESQVHIISPDKVDVFKKSVTGFYEEAKMISQLSHPNIVNVYNLYYENGTAFYTMEYLDGCDLRHYVARSGGRMNEEALMPIVACVAEALQTVHGKGLLHRDIAPDNIFIRSNGDVRLIDFGAARSTIANGGDGYSVILKQGFAPYEQYQRYGNQGPWTDIYALGATMMYCLSGRMPQPAMDRMSNPQLPVTCSLPIFNVINKMMQVNINDRYQSIAEFKKALFHSIQMTSSQRHDIPQQPVAVSPHEMNTVDYTNNLIRQNPIVQNNGSGVTNAEKVKQKIRQIFR